MDQVSAIMAFESGELSNKGTLELFRDLIQSGLAWTLQGSYGRSARNLIDMGLIVKTSDGWQVDWTHESLEGIDNEE